MSEKHLLFVDDEPFLCTLFKIGLKSQGITVVTANNGQEALDLVKSDNHKQIGVVLADVNMGAISGLELVERLRSLRPDIKAMLITAEPENQAIGQRWVAEGKILAYFDKIQVKQTDIFQKCVEAIKR